MKRINLGIIIAVSFATLLGVSITTVAHAASFTGTIMGAAVYSGPRASIASI